MRRGALALGLAALSSCLLPRAVCGAYMRFRPEVSIGAGYSDNVELRRKGEESTDQAALGRVRTLAGVHGPRVHLSGFGEFGVLKFNQDSDRDDTRMNAAARGEAELLEDWIYLVGQAAMAEVFDNPLAGVSASPVNTTENRVKVRSYRVNPFVRRAIGSSATVETGYTASAVDLDTEGINKSFTHQFTTVARSGASFPSLRWSATIDVENTARENSDGPDEDSKRRLVGWDGSWAAVGDVSLLGGFGLEDIRDDGLPDRIDGPVGYVGLAYEPNPRTFLSATGGRRFDRSVFSTYARHELGPRTRVSLAYDESLQTTQRLIRTGLGFLGTDPEGELIDRRTGRELVVGDPAFGLIEGTFYQKRLSAELERTSDRVDFAIELYGERRHLEREGFDDDAFGVNSTFKRWLNRRTSLDLQSRYWRVDFGNRSGEDRQIVGGIGFTRQLSSKLSVTATYFLSYRNSDEDLRDLRENSVIIGVQRLFGAGLRDEETPVGRRLPRSQYRLTPPEPRP